MVSNGPVLRQMPWKVPRITMSVCIVTGSGNSTLDQNLHTRRFIAVYRTMNSWSDPSTYWTPNDALSGNGWSSSYSKVRASQTKSYSICSEHASPKPNWYTISTTKFMTPFLNNRSKYMQALPICILLRCHWEPSKWWDIMMVIWTHPWEWYQIPPRSRIMHKVSPQLHGGDREMVKMLTTVYSLLDISQSSSIL